jgi:PTS system ascorbate-specific IIA component
MTRLLLIAHAPLASALWQVAQHVFPDCGLDLQAIDVPSSSGADEVEQALRERLEGVPAGESVLILADVLGATPCNAAMRVADGVRARVVTGVNVPMLWRTLCYQHEDLERLVERAVTGARAGCEAGDAGAAAVAAPGCNPATLCP